ncbi:HNH endonuclease family protein [Cellulomonas gilvus]|uniref:HNH endonuclease family protein n=1 Tax=Cellulomonas gilvus TaxID=11 RepID=UPI0003048358|nr:HNH endonuclease family protein [Cellulomonas gilvus]
MRGGARIWWVVLVLTLVVGLGGPVLLRERAAARHPVRAVDLASGRAALGALVVGPAAPADDYERDRFGTAWADVDGNGCSTREDVLRRDLVLLVVDVDACTVLSGTLDDPYTGARTPFRRGADSAAVQIDHVVALQNAWISGARDWSPALRLEFANDPANLLAVDGPTNQDKGASDAAAWLPPNSGFACRYALQQIRVKAAYALRVTPDERSALETALDTCVTV